MSFKNIILKKPVWRLWLNASCGLLIAGCSNLTELRDSTFVGDTFDPFVDVDHETQRKAETNSTVTFATEYGWKLRQRYRAAVSNRTILQRTTNLPLVAALGAAANFSVRGIADQAVLGLLIGSAAFETGRRTLTSRQQQSIQAAGSRAVTCILGHYTSMRGADEAAITYANTRGLDGGGGAGKKRNGALALVSLISELRSEAQNSVNLQNEPATLSLIEEALSKGGEAAVVLNTGGASMLSAFSAVKDVIDQVLITTEVNSASISALLAQTLVTTATPINPAIAQKLNFSSSPFAPLSPGVKRKMIKLATEIIAVYDLARVLPTDEELKNCFVQSNNLPGKLVVVPDAINLSKTTNQRTINVFISGGRLPYSSRWINVVNGLPAPNLTYDQSGSAILELTIAQLLIEGS